MLLSFILYLPRRGGILKSSALMVQLHGIDIMHTTSVAFERLAWARQYLILWRGEYF
jgi:hypothetical protein